MIGHPVLREWYRRHGAVEGRASVDDPHVRRLLAQLAPDLGCTDLGGQDSLNLRLDGQALVLRVHKPFVSRQRLLAEHELRRQLSGHGLTVPTSVPLSGSPVQRCGARLAELERYVPQVRPAPETPAFRWRFAALGRLHRALAEVASDLPRPLVRGWVSPVTLRRWLDLNQQDRHESCNDAATVGELDGLIRTLRAQWVSPLGLPTQLIHDDAHPGNVCATPSGEPAYLDFGGVAAGPRIQDLAYALAHMMFGLLRDQDHAPANLPWPEVPTLLQAYEDASGQHLSADERRALAPYTAAVPLYYDICDWGDRPWRGLSRWLLANPDALAG